MGDHETWGLKIQKMGSKPLPARHLPRSGHGGRSGLIGDPHLPKGVCVQFGSWGTRCEGTWGLPSPSLRRVGHKRVSKHQDTLIRKDGHSILLRIKGWS